MSFKQFMMDGLAESFGRPAKLLRLLTERPDIRVPLVETDKSIASEKVVRWHEFGVSTEIHSGRRKQGALLGWRKKGGGYYNTFYLHRAEFEQLVTKIVIEQWPCEIQEVHGFSASKSELTKFSSMDEMVERNSKEMITDISPEGLAKNLAHNEIRIMRPNTDDCFKYHRWDQRLFLINSGGSHHFAAAKYIASRIGVPVPLAGRLHLYTINPDAIASLRRDFDIFMISDKPEISVAFNEAMRSFEATWLWTFLPRPYHNARAILLPKNERRSQRVAQEFKEAAVVDLGAYLEELSSVGDENCRADPRFFTIT